MKRIFNFRPIFLLAVSICLGILSAFLFVTGQLALSIVITSCVGLSVIFFLILKNGKFRYKIIFSTVFLVVFFVGATFFGLEFSIFARADYNAKRLTINGKIISLLPTDSGSTILLDDVSFSGLANEKTSYRIKVYVTGESALDIGDYVELTSVVWQNSTFYDGGFNSQNVAERIKYSCSVNAEEIIYNKSRPNVFEKVNLLIRNTLRKGLGDNEFSVAYALLCGNAEYVDGEVITGYRYAGVAHIFAVSGLHIGFMASIFTFVLVKLKCNRYARAVITIFGLVFYSGVCGFSASSLRATIMCAVLLVAQLMGMKYDGLSSVSLAALIILFFAPVQLFCVGFQLSFMVVLGILLLSKPIARLFRFMPEKIANSFGAVLSAQIFGIPICLSTFGYASTISIIFNLVMIPFVGVFYIFLFAMTLLSFIPNTATVFLFIPNSILYVINQVIVFLDLKIFLISGFSFGGLAALYYLICLMLSGKINIKRKLNFILCTVLTFSLIGGSVGKVVKENKSYTAYVIGSQSFCAVMLDLPNENVLIVNKASEKFSLSGIDKLCSKLNLDCVNTVILVNGNNEYDIQQFVTRLRGVVEVSKLYAFKVPKVFEEEILTESFPQIEFVFCQLQYYIQCENFSFSYKANGRALHVTSEKYSFAAFSEFDDSQGGYIDQIESPLTFTVAYNYLEQLEYLYPSNKMISYRRNDAYLNAENQGRLRMSLV